MYGDGCRVVEGSEYWNCEAWLSGLLHGLASDKVSLSFGVVGVDVRWRLLVSYFKREWGDTYIDKLFLWRK